MSFAHYSAQPTILLITAILLNSRPIFALDDAICGELQIFKQKWIAGTDVRPLGSATHSADLQQCLQRCCTNPSCSAFSFSGFLQMLSPSDSNNANSSTGRPSSSSSSVPLNLANCALFQCHPSRDGDDCPMVDGTDVAADQGLLSVRLKRNDVDKSVGTSQPPLATTTTIARLLLSATTPSSTSTSATWTTTPSSSAPNDRKSVEEEGSAEAEFDQQQQRHTLSLDNGGTSAEDQSAMEETEEMRQLASTTTTTTTTTTTRTTTIRKKQRTKSLLDLNTWDERFPLRAETTPVWAIGLAIVITVICLGLLASLFCAFFCYRRHKLRMRTMEFSRPKKMSTLHAFNPS